MAMSEKKLKEKKAPLQEGSTPLSNSGVFGFLFGEIPEENSKASIFSDSNPFKRKPGDYSETSTDQKKDLGLDSESPSGRTTKSFDGSAEVKKGKRDEEKKGDSVGGSEGDEATPFEVEDGNPKKLKRVQSGKEGSGRKKGNMGLEGEAKEVNGAENNAKNKKKKRKRDEVEADYEEWRYGVEEVKVEGVGVVGRKRKEMESLKDIMVDFKEGFDDESKLLRTVFVGNLPLKIKKKLLIKEFGKFGEVESVRIRSIPLNDSKLPRKVSIMKKQINEAADSVHAYLVFKTEESAHASLAHNMAVVGGNHIRVDRVCPPRKKLKGDNIPLYDHKRTVFVGNLPFDVKDEELYKLFSSIKDVESTIEAIRIVRDPGTSLGKCIAYVLFKTRDAANLVVTGHRLKLQDRDLRVYHAKTAVTTPLKRRNPFPTETKSSPAKKFSLTKLTNPGDKIKSWGSLSYQGLRASKSGSQKKANGLAKSKLSSQKVHVQNERKEKRPAVATRKAEALKAKRTGFKRKPGKQTKARKSYGPKILFLRCILKGLDGCFEMLRLDFSSHVYTKRT